MSEPAKTIFFIEIMEGEKAVGAVIRSVEEGKEMGIRAPNMRLLLAAICKHIKKRRSVLRHFPIVKRTIFTAEELQRLGNGH